MKTRLPVTVVHGFRGAGKTALVNHVIRTCPHRRLAVIVPPDSRDLLDLSGLAGAVSVHCLPERYEKRRGCKGDCFLRGDLLVNVDRIARHGGADYAIIESTGLAPPLPVAQTFAYHDPSDYCLGDLARIDAVVTVVDAAEFLPEFLSGNVLEQDRALVDVGIDDDEATSSHLLALQVEFANLLVLNKADRVSSEFLHRLATICHHLNPDARIVPAQFGKLSARRLVGTGSFDPAETARSAGWLQQLRGAYVADCPVHQVRSFVYRARRPFHPTRLWEFIQGDWPGVLECKGYFWLASRREDVGGWSQCGPVCHVTRLGRWWADVPPEQWPDAPAARERIERNWERPHGDRRQELAICCVGIDPTRIRHDMDRCLLSDGEMHGAEDCWSNFDDPFPSWCAMAGGDCSSRPTMIRNR